jgi:hypothetical protein
MRKDLTIALAISLALGAAAVWGSCAVPRRASDVKAYQESPAPQHLSDAHPRDANHVVIMSEGPEYPLN